MKKISIYSLSSVIKTFGGTTIKRKCWKCNSNLLFFYFCAKNITYNINKVDVEKDVEKAKKIWNNPHIQVLCCNCFDVHNKS